MPEATKTIANIFEVQPAWCRAPLAPKVLDIEKEDDSLDKALGGKIYVFDRKKYVERVKRVLFYDPTELYARIGHLIDPYKRHAQLQMEQVFPKIEKFCACGCGQLAKASEPGAAKPWQQKWHNDSCALFAGDVLSIINNYFGKPAKYITYYYGDKCAECNGDHWNELDHLHGVKQGGGGSWLSNYKWKCKTCHVDKTNKTFGRGKHKNTANA